MSNSRSAEKTAAVTAALAELGIRPGERVLITLPDGPGFAGAFAGIIEHGAVPLPVSPSLFAHDLLAVAAESGARLLLAPADQIHRLTGLGAQSPVLIDGPQGHPWAAALPLCSSRSAQATGDCAPAARTRVVLLPHTQIESTGTQSRQCSAPGGPPA
ncbi:MAG TPA: AMP-binding protein [Pseudonocardiaceae bacterium]|nr:AMP-binding protein [Pseudonocardiaceae bacterium]